MLIDGELVSSNSQIDVYNPATGQVVAAVPDCTEDQLDEAVQSARSAFPAWRDLTFEERAEKLVAFGKAVTNHQNEFTALFTKEQGRPIGFAATEIAGLETWFNATAELRPPVNVAEDSAEQYVETRYVPLGVVCAIVPWNFPIKDIFPKGVLNIISGGEQLGPQMTSHSGFDKISFTGSSATGKKVMETASKDLKRVTLELGGNDAAIVLDDVDVEQVAEKIFFGAFFNTAQVCVATKRLYVHEDIYDSLRDRLHAIASATIVGDGSQQGVTMGPIQNKRQYDRVVELMEDAKSEGLTLLQGRDVPDGEGYFVPITIVDNPPEESRVVQEEAFGPILPMMKFNDIEDVIVKANDSQYGLAGAVWSKDTGKAVDIARQIETGTIWVNQNLNMRPDTPFGGRKQSGVGVEYGVEGLLEFMAPQSIFVAK